MNQTTFNIFLITIPGLEDLALSELEKKISFFPSTLSYKKVAGGIEINSNTVKDIYFVHQYLKIPTRALLRIKEFKARDFPSLYKHLLKIDWNQYIPWDDFKLSFSSYKSKIFDERKVQKCLNDAIRDYKNGNPAKEKYKKSPPPYEASVFIRAYEDQFLVSIDLTGERLDRREKKLFSTAAPMRESLASAMIEQTLKNIHYDLTDISILDPMAGSGTLLFEVYDYYRISNRKYNYEFMPFYASCPEKTYKKIDSLVENNLFLWANDISDEAIKSLHENQKNYSDIKLEITKIDYFSNEFNDYFKQYNDLEKKEFILLSNPPYNLRIKTEDTAEIFINRFISAINNLDEKVSQFSLIFPSEVKIKSPKDFKLLEKTKTLNGGLEVTIYTFSRL